MTKPTRRDALKALTAATGALSLAALPDEWTTPVINAGKLPPHAQTSLLCWTSPSDSGTPIQTVLDCGQICFFFQTGLSTPDIQFGITSTDPGGGTGFSSSFTDANGLVSFCLTFFAGAGQWSYEWAQVGNPQGPRCSGTFEIRDNCPPGPF